MIRPDWSKWSKVSAGGYTFISKADVMPASRQARVVIIRYRASSPETNVIKTVYTFIGTWKGVAKDWSGSWKCGSLGDALGNEKDVVVGEPANL